MKTLIQRSVLMLINVASVAAFGQDDYARQRVQFSVGFHQEFVANNHSGLSISYHRTFSPERKYYLGLQFDVSASKNDQKIPGPNATQYNGSYFSQHVFIAVSQRYFVYNKTRSNIFVEGALGYRAIMADATANHEQYIPERYVFGSWIPAHYQTISNDVTMSDGGFFTQFSVGYFFSIFNNASYHKGLYLKPSINIGKKTRLMDKNSLRYNDSFDVQYSNEDVKSVFPSFAIGIIL